MPAALRYAFESGYHTKVDRNTGQIQQQDGFISSLVTFTFILPLGLSVCVSHWITLNKQTHDVDSDSVLIVSTTYMLISIVIMLILRLSAHAESLYAETGEEESDIPQPGDSQVEELRLTFEQFWNLIQRVFWRIIRVALPLIGLVLFYSISIIQSMFRIVAITTCIHTFRECQLLRNYAVNLGYQCMKILFMGVLMLFSIFFKKKVLLRCCVTRFSLIFIMAAAATMWLDISIYDARSMSTVERDVNRCRPLDIRILNYTDWKCVNENTNLFETVQRMSPYFYPVNIEFLLLCIEILIKLFFTMKSDDVIRSLKIRGRHIRCQGNGNRESENEGSNVSAHYNNQIITQNDNPEADNGEPETCRNYGNLDSPQDSNINSLNVQNPYKEATDAPDSANAEVSHGHTEVTGPARVRHAHFGQSTSSKSAHEPYQYTGDLSATPIGTGHSDAPVTAYGAVNYGATRDTCSQPGNENNTRADGAMNDAIISMGRAPNTREQSFAVWYLVTIVINALFIVFGALTNLSKARDTWDDIYQIAKIIYWIPLLGAIGIAYPTLPDMESAFFEYSGLELMVVFSIFGFALNVFFSLIAAVSVIGGSRPIAEINYMTTNFNSTIFEYPKAYIPTLVIAEKMLNIMQVFFQSNLLLHASRVKRRAVSDSSRKYGWFCVVIMYLAFCNLVLWGIDSFVEMKNICLVPTEDFYFGEDAWHLINHLTGPFILFYRFNCGISFLEVLLAFKYS